MRGQDCYVERGVSLSREMGMSEPLMKESIRNVTVKSRLSWCTAAEVFEVVTSRYITRDVTHQIVTSSPQDPG